MSFYEQGVGHEVQWLRNATIITGSKSTWKLFQASEQSSIVGVRLRKWSYGTWACTQHVLHCRWPNWIFFVELRSQMGQWYVWKILALSLSSFKLSLPLFISFPFNFAVHHTSTFIWCCHEHPIDLFDGSQFLKKRRYQIGPRSLPEVSCLRFWGWVLAVKLKLKLKWNVNWMSINYSRIQKVSLLKATHLFIKLYWLLILQLTNFWLWW